MVLAVGFEPTKAEPEDLQSPSFEPDLDTLA